MHHDKTPTRDQGFTLVELLVVMIIVGILAAVAVPVFLQQRVKAVDTSIRSDLKSLSQEVALYDANNPGMLQQASGFGYLRTTDAAAMAGPGTGLNLVSSPGNTLQLKAFSDGSYCLRGWNPKGSTTGTGSGSSGTYIYYDTRAGGVRSGAAVASTVNCPAA